MINYIDSDMLLESIIDFYLSYCPYDFINDSTEGTEESAIKDINNMLRTLSGTEDIIFNLSETLQRDIIPELLEDPDQMDLVELKDKANDIINILEAYKRERFSDCTAYGIYINCKSVPFIDMILNGDKTLETRGKNVFKGIIGERVYLIQTGTGSPVIRGIASVGNPVIISYDNIAMRKKACIYRTAYDVKPRSAKYFYPLVNVESMESVPLPENRINHGRSFTEFRLESMKGGKVK